MMTTATLLLLLGPSVCAPPPSGHGDLCDLFLQRPHWYRLTQQAADRWEVEEALLIAVIEQESGFRARARPARRRLFGIVPWGRASSAFGYAQALDVTWQQFERQRGEPAARHRFGDAVDFVGWYLAEVREQLGLSSTDSRNLYLAYHEGPSGYRRRSHLEKAWLLGVADRLDQRVDRYRTQLAECSASLERRIRLRRFVLVVVLVAATTVILLGLRTRRLPWLRS